MHVRARTQNARTKRSSAPSSNLPPEYLDILASEKDIHSDIHLQKLNSVKRMNILQVRRRVLACFGMFLHVLACSCMSLRVLACPCVFLHALAVALSCMFLLYSLRPSESKELLELELPRETGISRKSMPTRTCSLSIILRPTVMVNRI